MNNFSYASHPRFNEYAAKALSNNRGKVLDGWHEIQGEIVRLERYILDHPVNRNPSQWLINSFLAVRIFFMKRQLKTIGEMDDRYGYAISALLEGNPDNAIALMKDYPNLEGMWDHPTIEAQRLHEELYEFQRRRSEASQ